MATGCFRLLNVSAGSLVSDCFAVQKSMTCLSSGGKVQARKSIMRYAPVSCRMTCCSVDRLFSDAFGGCPVALLTASRVLLPDLVAWPVVLLMASPRPPLMA